VVLRIGDAIEETALADHRGEFALRLSGGDASSVGGRSGVVTAHAPDGWSGRVVWTMPAQQLGVHHLPTILVQASATLEVSVERPGGTREAARVTVVCRDMARFAPVAEMSTDGTGVATFARLPAGDCLVIAATQDLDFGQVAVKLEPGERRRALVELHPGRDVEVAVHAPDGSPIEGASVEIENPTAFGGPWDDATLAAPSVPATDALGRSRFTFWGCGRRLQIRTVFRPDGNGEAVWWGHGLLGPGATETQVTAGPLQAFRFPLAGGWRPRTGDDIQVSFATSYNLCPRCLETDAVRAEVDGDSLWLHNVPSTVRGGWFKADANRVARFQVPSTGALGDAIVFREQRTIRLRLEGDSGLAREGVLLRLSCPELGMVTEPVETDAEGIASLLALSGTVVRLEECVRSLPPACREIATLRIDQLSDPHPVRVPDRVELRLHVYLDGEKRLPASYEIEIDGQLKRAPEIVEDDTASLVRVSHRPVSTEGDTSIVFSAAGYAVCTVAVPSPGNGDGSRDVDLSLTSTTAVEVTVLEPADGQYALTAMRYDPSRQTWVGASVRPRTAARSASDDAAVLRFEALQPGTYRFRDALCREVSEDVVVRAGMGVTSTVLDLRQCVDLVVCVEGPHGAALDTARVLVSREGKEDRRLVTAQGQCRVRVLRWEWLRVRAEHDAFPAKVWTGAVDGIAEVPRITVRLEAGARLTFRLTDDSGVPLQPDGVADVAVYLDHKNEDGLSSRRSAVWTGAHWECSGIAAGDYDLTFDASGYAPESRGDVRIESGTRDLGTIALHGGYSIRVLLLFAAGETITNLWATAHPVATDERHARRGVLSEDGAALVIRGMAVGRHRVRVGCIEMEGAVPKSRNLLDRVVDLDGSSDVVLQVDLRDRR
jgi:hypothetical protein